MTRSKTIQDYYQTAVEWIAYNDAPGDDDDVEALTSYLTVCLVADVFGIRVERVARSVKAIRDAERE